MIAMSQFHI
jgi:hypothetical protein